MTFRFAIAALAASAGTASANIRITEYLYQGLNGSTQVTFEYIELTNLSAAPIDMTGWSFDDDGRGDEDRGRGHARETSTNPAPPQLW